MENINKLYEIIRELNLDGETVANLFTDWNGNQIVGDEFIEFVNEELGL